MRLSPRQTETLYLLASGRTRALAADAMRISPRTVRFHVESICRKTGERTLLAAVVRVLSAPK